MSHRLVAMALGAFAFQATSVVADDLVLSGVRNVKLLDAGQFIVSGKAPSARIETFEFLERPEGGFTLLSTTTIADGSAQVQARYDYDEDWNAIRALGQGIYEDEPVRVNLTAEPSSVTIEVRGDDTTKPCVGCSA